MGGTRRHRRSRLGSMLIATGLLGLLGGSFGLGVVVGRHWSYFSTLMTRKASGESRREASEGRGADTSRRVPETIPTLTFYQELTAPLASPPPAQLATPSPVRSAAPSQAQRAAPSPVPQSSLPASVQSAAPSPQSETAPATGSFTVQLAAYKVRSQAEALRETLAARGIEAYVSEASPPSGTRYRVRVGPFENKDEARQKAVTLAADTRLGAFVTSDGAPR